MKGFKEFKGVLSDIMKVDVRGGYEHATVAVNQKLIWLQQQGNKIIDVKTIGADTGYAYITITYEGTVDIAGDDDEQLEAEDAEQDEVSESVPEQEEVAMPERVSDYSDMTNKQLMQEIKDRGLDRGDAYKKEQFVAILQEDDAE